MSEHLYRWPATVVTRDWYIPVFPREDPTVSWKSASVVN